MVKGILVYS